MKKQNYIVLIQYTAVASHTDVIATATVLNTVVRKALDDCEAIHSSRTAVAFVGRSSRCAIDIFRSLGAHLAPGDQLTVSCLGPDCATSLPSLHSWRTRTDAADAQAT